MQFSGVVSVLLLVASLLLTMADTPKEVLPLGASLEDQASQDQGVDPREDDQHSTSSQKSKRSLSPGSGPMYKTCQGCNKGNKLMASDLHEECMACLGMDHLFQMKSCMACQALGFKDRFKRARRFAYQRNTGQFVTARTLVSL